MSEFELKFQVPADSAEAVEAALRRGTVRRTRLRARYFDTPDQALARAGLVLRLRQEGRHWVQTAKGPGEAAFERLEHDAPVERGGAEAGPDPSRHAGHPVHALLQKALRKAKGPLQPTFETDVVRLARTVRASGTQIEIAFDNGTVRAGGRSQTIRELELELKQGSTAALVELAQGWCERHGLWLDPLSKSGLGRRMAGGTAEPPAATWQHVPRGQANLLAALLEACLGQILANLRQGAAGTGGDEHVHQLRVGLRHLRTLLRELRPLGAGAAVPAHVEPTLEGLFSVLGAHRDQATLLPALLREVAHAGNPMQPWQPVLPDIASAVREPAVQSALLHLVALSQAWREGGAPGARSIRALARERLQRLHRKATRRGLHFEALAEAQRHQVRKRLKRLRYLAELMRPLFATKKVDAYVAALADLQDALGRYQDAAAGRELLARRAAEDPGAWFGVGWLAAREDALAAECATACRRTVRHAQPFWR
jgi:inorganic triphosphatase YgiF